MPGQFPRLASAVPSGTSLRMTLPATTFKTSSHSTALGLCVLLAVAGATALRLSAAGPRALPLGQLPNDTRLQPLKDLDGYFPFRPPASAADWERRAERVRRQMAVALGLWPMPSRLPLQPVIHGRIERDGYTVEKVYFESLPGFYVTGSLYRPAEPGSGPRPGVLCPHGHWSNGRFHDAGVEAVRREIVEGAERFEEGGRSPLQARCVQLARMGCVVFHYDMLGYADSGQIPSAIAHGFAKQRPEMNQAEDWGLFSPQAEAHYQSVMGLQTWNSLRALDFLLELPGVDPKRIAVTGASGGGTQTFVLCALDPRPALAFPAVMVSTAMQGGCTCENACGLRVDTGNVEFAALFAPKPQGLTSANDWTKEMATQGYPELQALYALVGSRDRVMLKRGEHFGHNYNYVSRAAMYAWVNRQFQLGLKEPIVEADYRRLSQAELSVWDDQHPRPPGGPEFERKLLSWWTADSARHLAEAQAARASFERVYGGGIDIVLGRNLAEVGEVTWDERHQDDLGTFQMKVGLVRNTGRGEEVPVVVLEPRSGRGETAIWLDPAGKAGLFAAAGESAGGVKPEVRRLIEAGWTVVGVDLLFQGEFLAEGEAVTQTRRVKNPREAAAYTFGYNHSLFAQRVHDVLAVIQHVRTRAVQAPKVSLVGLGGAGPWAAAACAQARGAIERAVIDTAGFRFGRVRELQSPDFLPGGAKYGDLPGMIAVGLPRRLALAGEGDQVPRLIGRAAELSPEPCAVKLLGETGTALVAAAVNWLVGDPVP
ncbi:MAG: acetylxylan esterase [Verrucomicrobia bacterium]|nr:acetylxylan esterase [Verrucomicrobiota bacterium]